MVMPEAMAEGAFRDVGQALLPADGSQPGRSQPEKDLLIFDMDGVLVDVTESYRAAIQQTVLHFSGTEPTREEIQQWKNRGGFNDDWKLSHAMIASRGTSARFNDVVDYFQNIFHGDQANGVEGLILRERWLASEGLFDRLARQHKLAVFTGRLRWEAIVTLKRFTPIAFDPVIGLDDVSEPKPHPEGLKKICSSVPHSKCWYLGDTVDDARAAKAANIPFIGIASKLSPHRSVLVRLLESEGAVAVIEDINAMENVLAANR